MKNLVRALRAMADEPRMTILSVLSIRGAVCVSHLQEAMKTPQPTVSRYLSILRNAGLLESERRGQWVYYNLSDDDGSLIMEMIHRASDQLKDTSKIRRIMERLDKLEEQPPLTEESAQVKPSAKTKNARKPSRKTAKGVEEVEALAREGSETNKLESAIAPEIVGKPEIATVSMMDEQQETIAEPALLNEKEEPDKTNASEKGPESEGKKKTRKKKQQLPSLFDL